MEESLTIIKGKNKNAGYSYSFDSAKKYSGGGEADIFKGKIIGGNSSKHICVRLKSLSNKLQKSTFERNKHERILL